MKQTIKRLTALILAMAMALSLLSVSVWADELGGADASGSEPVAQTEAQADDAEESKTEGKEVEAPGAEDETGADTDTDPDADSNPNAKRGVELKPQREPAFSDDDATDMLETYDEVVSFYSERIALFAERAKSEDFDWRLHPDSSDFYNQCAQAVIDGKTDPDFDVHFDYAGLKVDYLYNGDGTYTLSTSGDASDKTYKKLMRHYDLITSEGGYKGPGHTDSWKYEELSLRAWLNRYKEAHRLNIPINSVNLDYDGLTEEEWNLLQEMKEFPKTVQELSKRFLVTKVICDSTWTYDQYYTLTKYKQGTREIENTSRVVEPIGDSWNARFAHDGWPENYKDHVVELTFGPSVKAAFVDAYPVLTKVNWGKNVSEIANNSFAHCDSLKKITIPATVKRLGDNKGCAYPAPTSGDFHIRTSIEEVVFQGDIVIETSFSKSPGYKKITALGDVTLYGTSMSAESIDIKGNLKCRVNDDKKPRAGFIYADHLTVGGNAILDGCKLLASGNPAKGITMDVGGNLSLTSVLNAYHASGIYSNVKSLSVGKNFKVDKDVEFEVDGSDDPIVIESIYVGGKVTQPKGSFHGTAFEYYPIKSHGTTTFKEAKGSWLQKPTKVSVKSTQKGKMTVKWSFANKVGSGVQIRYSTDPEIKKGVKKITVKGRRKTSISIPKLKSGKDVFVEIRTYWKNGRVSDWAYGDCTVK